MVIGSPDRRRCGGGPGGHFPRCSRPAGTVPPRPPVGRRLPPRFPGKSNQVPAGLIDPVRALSRIQPLLRVSMGEVYGVRLRGHIRIPGCRPWAKTGSTTSRRALLSGRPAVPRAALLSAAHLFARKFRACVAITPSRNRPCMTPVIHAERAERHALSRVNLYGQAAAQVGSSAARPDFFLASTAKLLACRSDDLGYARSARAARHPTDDRPRDTFLPPALPVGLRRLAMVRRPAMVLRARAHQSHRAWGRIRPVWNTSRSS
jgi:hypothetical protein